MKFALEKHSAQSVFNKLQHATRKFAGRDIGRPGPTAPIHSVLTYAIAHIKRVIHC